MTAESPSVLHVPKGPSEKTRLTRGLRDLVLTSFPESARLRRVTSASGYLSYDHSYLCVHIQHRQLTLAAGYEICVNCGVFPKAVFASYRDIGRVGAHPGEIDCPFRFRMTLQQGYDQWWVLPTPAALAEITPELRQAAHATWQTRIAPLLDPAAQCDQLRACDTPECAFALQILSSGSHP